MLKPRIYNRLLLLITAILIQTLLVFSVTTASAMRGQMLTLPDGLSASVSLPKETIYSTDGVLVSVKFKNTTKEQIRFLKWATPFDDNVQFDMFDIIVDGKRLPYVGRKIRRAPPQERDYLTIGPQGEISITVDIEFAYGVQRSGQYRIAYKNNKNFDSKRTFIAFKVIDNRVASRSKRRPANFSGCSANQINTLNQDVNTAEPIAKKSYEDLDNAPIARRSSAARYLRWFGAYSPARYQEALDTMRLTYFAFRDKTLVFECNSSCTELASVDPDLPFEIRICESYFSQPLVSTQSNPDESRAGTLIHEITHFSVVGQTEDHAYFTDDSLALAKNNPAFAVDNADNFYFFAENVFPPLPMPGNSINTVPMIMLLLD